MDLDYCGLRHGVSKPDATDTPRNVAWGTVTEPAHDGLNFVTFRADDKPERLDGWYEAQQRGFHQGRTSEELRQHFGEHLRADDVVLRGVWQDSPALGSGTIPVATYASYDKTLNTGNTGNTGSGLQRVRMISDVTVSPTHRRRGLLRTMMTVDLADAVEQGVPLAVLTASEGAIYGRFGFGPAIFEHALEVDTGPRFALRPFVDDGSVELLEPAEAWPAMAQIFARFHEQTRGSVERPQFYEPILTGAFNFEDGEDRKLRTAVHVDGSGTPDGYVAYRPNPRKDGPARSMSATWSRSRRRRTSGSGVSSPTSTSATASSGAEPPSTIPSCGPWSIPTG
ncbi:MAG TPA: hypothetical protein DEQ43_24510 [Nocardioides bacterium]|nr:hypothetical protein [Nocardioides sp.]